MRGVVLLLGAGSGERLGKGPKALVDLAGLPILRRAAEAAASARLVEGIIAAVPRGFEARAAEVLRGLGVPCEVVAGGATRQASATEAAARAVGAEALCVHDAARALCPPGLFDACLGALDSCEAAIVALSATDTIKEVQEDEVVGTFDRGRLAAAQTPQAFRAATYLKALRAAADEGFEATDDSALVERLGIRVRVIPGDERNIKITSSADLRLAEALLRE